MLISYPRAPWDYTSRPMPSLSGMALKKMPSARLPAIEAAVHYSDEDLRASDVSLVSHSGHHGYLAFFDQPEPHYHTVYLNKLYLQDKTVPATEATSTDEKFPSTLHWLLAAPLPQQP